MKFHETLWENYQNYPIAFGEVHKNLDSIILLYPNETSYSKSLEPKFTSISALVNAREYNCTFEANDVLNLSRGLKILNDSLDSFVKFDSSASNVEMVGPVSEFASRFFFVRDSDQWKPYLYLHFLSDFQSKVSQALQHQ